MNRQSQFRSNGFDQFVDFSQLRKVYSGLIMSSITFQVSKNCFCVWILSQFIKIILAFGNFYFCCHYVPFSLMESHCLVKHTKYLQITTVESQIMLKQPRLKNSKRLESVKVFSSTAPEKVF